MAISTTINFDHLPSPNFRLRDLNEANLDFIQREDLMVEPPPINYVNGDRNYVPNIPVERAIINARENYLREMENRLPGGRPSAQYLGETQETAYTSFKKSEIQSIIREFIKTNLSIKVELNLSGSELEVKTSLFLEGLKVVEFSSDSDSITINED